MLIRVRWQRFDRLSVPRQQSALALASLLAPSAVLAFSVMLWSLASDFRWTANFFVSSGFLSHWQVWLILSALLYLAFWLLNRYAHGRREDCFSDAD